MGDLQESLQSKDSARSEIKVALQVPGTGKCTGTPVFTNPGLARQGSYTGYSPSSTGEGEARTHAEHTDSERLPSEGVPVRSSGERSGERAPRALPNTAHGRGAGTAHGARRPEPGTKAAARTRALPGA